MRRELGWRPEAAGAPMSKKNIRRFNEKGMKPEDGMKARDWVRVVSHWMRCLNRRLLDFKAEPMPTLPSGWVRYWCEPKKRWMRSPSDGDSSESVPELPDRYFLGGHPALLLTTGDREGPGRRASHFMAAPEIVHGPEVKPSGGLNLMLDFLPSGDPYHGSWNNFKWACKHADGHLEATLLQLTPAPLSGLSIFDCIPAEYKHVV